MPDFEFIFAYFDGSGWGDVGCGDARGRLEADEDGIEEGGDRDPKDDLRGLMSGIPKRLCKRIRVDVGCLEVAAGSDDDTGSGGGGMGGGLKGEWERGGEEGALVLVRGWVSKSRSTLEHVEAGLTPVLPFPVTPEPPFPLPPYLIPFDLPILVCVGVTKLVIVECVPVVVLLNGRLWLLVVGFELPCLAVAEGFVLRVRGCRFS